MLQVQHRFWAVLACFSLICSQMPIGDFAFAEECEGDCQQEEFYENGNGGGNEEEESANSSPAPQGGGVQSGGHRGANTQGIRFTLVSLLSGIFNLTPEQRHQIVFGAYTVSTNFPVDTSLLGVPIDQDLRDVICKMMATISRHDDFAESRGIIAVIIADVFNENVNAVHTALGRIGFCTGGYSALSKTQPIVASETEEEYIFLVDQEGVPISSNPIWNACIRDTVLLRPDGKPYRCRRDEYHSGNRWYHPDIPMLEFSFNPRRNPRGIVLPEHIAILQTHITSIAYETP